MRFAWRWKRKPSSLCAPVYFGTWRRGRPAGAKGHFGPARAAEHGENVAAERDAIQKALSRLAPQKSRTFTGFAAPRAVWLLPAGGLTGSLLAEAREKHIEAKQKGRLVEVITRSLPSLYALRGFTEALLPFAVNVPATPQALAAAVEKGGLYDLLSQMHDGRGAFATRLEVRGQGVDRKAFTSDFFAAANSAQFLNSPSSYDIELRCWIKNNRAMLSVRLHTFADPRSAIGWKACPLPCTRRCGGAV
ncbi:MAG: hypothetical protein ACLT0Y_04800 [Christensenellales bacterium]